MNTNILNLTDEEYFTNPFKTEDDIVSKLSVQNFEGVTIGSPRFININEKQSLPVIACERRTFENIANSPFDESAVLVAVSLESGTVYANNAEQSPDNMIPIEPAPGEKSDIPQGTAAQMHDIDAKERLDIPWRESNLLLYLLIGNLRSNKTISTLVSDEISDPEEASAKEFQTLADQKRPSVTYPPNNPYPAYSVSEFSPPLPKGKGIFLTTEKKYSVRKGGPLVIHASYSIPVYEHEMMTEAQNTSADIKALVPMAILVSGTKQNFVGCYNIHVPCSSLTENEEGKTGSGYFSVDLIERQAIPATTQNYTIQVISRDVISEIVECEIVE